MDYQELLAELERDRENIDRMIAWLKNRMQQGTGPGTAYLPESSAKPTSATLLRDSPNLLGIPSDAFFRMSVQQAIKGFLNRAKRPMSAKDITTGLEAGGLTHQAKNLYATVYPTLLRMEDAGEVVRVSKGKWGLAEWYAGRKPATNEKQPEAE